MVFSINEPHPTVTKNAYVHSGRGGAGNFFRAPETTPSTGITTKPPLTSTPSTGRFYSGRGGAGNAASQRPVMSFDEQYQIQSQLEQKPITHIGRGGAGNVYATSSASKRKQSDASIASSVSSSGSGRSGIMARLSQIASRRSD